MCDITIALVMNTDHSIYLIDKKEFPLPIYMNGDSYLLIHKY